MNALTLYYSVSNGGDGSAYPKFSLSKELADIHQEMEMVFGEGFAESCTGQITLHSDSPITVAKEDAKWLITKKTLLKDLKYYLEGSERDTAQKFIDQINAIND